MSNAVILVDDEASSTPPAIQEEPERKTARPKNERLERSTKKQIAGTLKDLEANLRAGEQERAAFETIGRFYAGTTVGAAYSRMAEALSRNEGISLSKAFEAEHAIFPRVVRDLIAAGSEGTDLTLWRNMRRAAELLENSSDVARDTRNGVRGPLGLILLTIILLGISVKTQFADPEQMGGLAGTIAAITVQTVTVLAYASGVVIVLAIPLGIWWKQAGQHHPTVRLVIDRWMLRSRLFGPVTKLDVGARFSEVLAAAFDIPLEEPQALEIAARATGNSAIQEHMEAHIAAMRADGKSLADAADETLFPKTLKHRLQLQPGDAERILTLRELAAEYAKDAAKESEETVKKITNRMTNLSYAFVILVMAAIMVPGFLQLNEMSSVLHV